MTKTKIEVPKTLYYVLDEDGNARPVDSLDDWAKQFETCDRRMAYTQTENGTVISTVFLGLDHAWGEEQSPLIFETMVFKSHRFGSFQQRYSTKAEALAGHETTMQMVLSYERKKPIKEIVFEVTGDDYCTCCRKDMNNFVVYVKMSGKRKAICKSCYERVKEEMERRLKVGKKRKSNLLRDYMWMPRRHEEDLTD